LSASLINAQIPIPTVPIMDVRTGELNQAWYRFFLALLARTGGSIGTLGIPGGVNGNVQFNANGAFGGLTDAELTTLIGIFTDVLSGAVPPGGVGSTKFLRQDQVFALIDLGADVSGLLPFANLETLAASSLFGNPAVSAGTGSNVAVGSGLTLTVGGTLSATGAGSGTVTQVDTGALLTGGPITTTGTVSVAAIAANSLIANATTASAVPTAVPIGSGLTFTAGTLEVTSSGGSVTSVVIDAAPYLNAGTITTTGTVSAATLAATSLLGNGATVAAIPTAIAIGSNLTLSPAGTLSATAGGGSVTSVVIEGGAFLDAGTITSSGTISNAATPTAHTVLIGAGSSAVTNTATATAGQLLIGQSGATDPSFVSASGDLTINAGGTVAVTKVNGDANVAFLDVAQSFTKAQRSTPVALTSGATVTPDFSLSNNFSMTMTISGTLANPTNIVAGQAGQIVVTQDATGSRTLTYGTDFKFAGGSPAVLSTAANSVDVLSYFANTGSTILISPALAFA
jgi:hypothetical protein